MADVDRLGNILEMDSQSEKVTTAQTAEVKDKKERIKETKWPS